MGFFDIFKPKKKLAADPQNFDEIFELAANDIAYRPLFYRTILEKELFLLIHPDNDNLPKGKFTTNGDIDLKIRTLKDKKVPIFTSADKIYDNGVITGQERYVSMKGRAAFAMFKDPTTFLLNPYSRPSKELLPNEIQKLLSGEIFSSGKEMKIKAGSTIILGLPSKYPIALTETLKKYCDTREEIKSAYLALMHDESSGEPPHLLVGVDLTDHNKQIFAEIGETIIAFVPEGEPIDMINVAENTSTSKALKQKDYQIY